jgi:hypothetical protein
MNSAPNPTEDAFHKILEDARTDPNIIGFWLSGSRGKGLITNNSDYDCVMLVKDQVLHNYKQRYGRLDDPNLELCVSTLEEQKHYAMWGSHSAWDRYNFAHLKPLVDKTGQLLGLFEEKAGIPESERRGFIRGHLDGYINEVYRSLKCFRDGQTLGYRMQSAQSVTLLCTVLFALHGRVQPYPKYLEWELKNFPLEKMPLPPDELIRAILEIMETGSISAQQKLLVCIETMARTEGYGDVLDGWGQKLSWMKTFPPAPA